MIFIRRNNLVPFNLLFLLTMRSREARRVRRKHTYHVENLTSRTSSNFKYQKRPYAVRTFCSTLLTSAPSRPNIFSITGIKVMISGIAFDRPDRPSRLRPFPYDRFKICTIVPRSSTLSKRSRSSHLSASSAIVRVTFPCDRFDSPNIIWDDWDDHIETRLNISS